MPLKIVRNDITKMNTEAIVNTASAQVTVGAGCDNAVHMAAGYEELLEYRREHIGSVREGEVFISPGFNLQAKYIIHAVSPLYIDGKHGEEKRLRSCYKNSLKCAKKYGIKTISIPLISTGSFGYPKEDGLRIAVDEINKFLLRNMMDICLVVFDEKATQLGARLYPRLEEYINQNYVDAVGKRVYRKEYDKQTFKEKPVARMAEERVCYAEAAPCFDFEQQHASKLQDRMKHMSDTYSEYLLYLIKERNMENADVYKRAIVDKKVFSKIKNNPKYHPNKLTALCLCIGAQLNLDETKDLLSRAGYALSPCDMTDIIFSYFIENKIYDMIELDIQLEEHGLPCIIT